MKVKQTAFILFIVFQGCVRLHQDAGRDFETLFQDAVWKHKNGKIQEAEELYRHLLTLQPNHRKTLHNLALLEANDLKDFPMAISLLDRYLSIDSKSSEAKRVGKALLELDQVTNHSDLLLADVKVVLWKVDRERNLRRKLSLLEQGIAKFPTVSIFYMEKGEVLEKQGNWSEALSTLRKAAGGHPTSIEIRKRLGKLLKKMHRLDLAQIEERKANLFTSLDKASKQLF